MTDQQQATMPGTEASIDSIRDATPAARDVIMRAHVDMVATPPPGQPHGATA